MLKVCDGCGGEGGGGHLFVFASLIVLMVIMNKTISIMLADDVTTRMSMCV